jgi:hypothetical protein
MARKSVKSALPKSPKKPKNDRRVLDKKTWREQAKKTRRRGTP